MVNQSRLQQIFDEVTEVIPEDWPGFSCSRIIAAQIVNVTLNDIATAIDRLASEVGAVASEMRTE